MPYHTVDLCAGIGGIRKGFELTGHFANILSSEIDRFACATYQHLYGDNPHNDLTTEDFKNLVTNLNYEILLAGFPCQTFSRAGLQAGFEDPGKGIIFFHIEEIIRRSNPAVIFLENVDHIITHEGGDTFKHILETLDGDLNYRIIGTDHDDYGNLTYNPTDFVRNSKHFGVPQNRPRMYIIAFNRDVFGGAVDLLPNALPTERAQLLYGDLNDVLEHNVAPHYYMASGYFDTLIRHRARQRANGNGYGYKVVNAEGIEHPIANTLLATGGSGKERNLIFDPQEGIAGMTIPTKKTSLNIHGIRVMTPTEWGRLQGFIDYAFVDEQGEDHFSFPEEITDAQKYKQFGNSVTIPVIEVMANFIVDCLNQLGYNEPH